MRSTGQLVFANENFTDSKKVRAMLDCEWEDHSESSSSCIPIVSYEMSRIKFS